VRPLVFAEQSDRPLNQLIAYSPFEPANMGDLSWAKKRNVKLERIFILHTTSTRLVH